MKKILVSIMILLSFTLVLTGSRFTDSIEKIPFKEQTAMKMNVQVGAYTFTATLEDNDAVRELMEMMQAGPITIHMSDYSGFEKVGSLGRSLTTSNLRITTVAGDIVLYNGNNIVMFYGSNSWSYTRIGKIDDLTDWATALGNGDITAIFTAPGPGKKGDLSNDGNINIGDVVKLARAVAGYITLTDEERELGDVTGDGEISIGDVVKLARYVAGYISSL